MGVYLWIDYLKGIIKNSKKLYGIVDSGIFLDPVSLGKIGLQSFQVLSMFAPNALLSSTSATSNQPGGSITINENQQS